MHEHLRAWREFRGLTLEGVAASMGKKHSTISRWECGKMPLKTKDLEKLAKLYGASRSQIMAPPEEAELVAKLDEVQKILERLKPDDLEHWLAMGRALGRISPMVTVIPWLQSLLT